MRRALYDFHLTASCAFAANIPTANQKSFYCRRTVPNYKSAKTNNIESKKVVLPEVSTKTTLPLKERMSSLVLYLNDLNAKRRLSHRTQLSTLLAHHPKEPLEALWSVLNDKSLLGPELPMAICSIERQLYAPKESDVKREPKTEDRWRYICKPEPRENEGATPLILAARAKRPEVVAALVAAGAKINTFDVRGNSALHHAAANSDIRSMELLLEKGAYVDLYADFNEVKTPLISAVSWPSPSLEAVKLLVAKGASIEVGRYKRTLLFIAAQNGYAEIVSFLLLSKANTKAEYRGRTPMHAAAENGHLDVVKTFIEHGVPVDITHADNYSWGQTPLLVAAGAGQLQVVKYLFSLGADVNAKDQNGKTILYYAVQKRNSLLEGEYSYSLAGNNAEVVEYLISSGAPVNEVINGKTLLHVAVEKGDLEVIKILLKYGAGIKATNCQRESIFYYCVPYI